MRGANLHRADLSSADVRGAIGLRFNENPARDLLIEGNAPDPWSQLRRKYTGPWFFVHAALIVAFILPYVGKVLALTAADRAVRQLEGALPTEERVHAVWVLIGATKAWWVPVLGLVLLVYNGLRLMLTMQVGMLRDAEERSGVTPALAEYMGTQGLDEEKWHKSAGIATGQLFAYVGSAVRFGVQHAVRRALTRVRLKKADPDKKIRARMKLERIGFWRIHQLMRILFWLAVMSFAGHALHWAFTTTVPVMG